MRQVAAGRCRPRRGSPQAAGLSPNPALQRTAALDSRSQGESLSGPRPLSYCAEIDLEKFAAAMRFPIIPCDLCGSQEGLQRNAMKAMLEDIEKRMPGRKDTMIRAMTNVRPSHLLDRKLFDFAALDARLTAGQDISNDI